MIVVDMQNDFCSKGGLFDHAGINISAVQKGDRNCSRRSTSGIHCPHHDRRQNLEARILSQSLS